MKSSSYLIAFDYDGVIADSITPNIDMMNKLFIEMNIDFSLEKIDFEALNEISFEAVADLAKLNSSEREKFLFEVHNRRDTILEKTDIFIGISEVIKALAKKATLTIVSNNHSVIAKTTLEKNCLNNFFTEITGIDSNKNKSTRLQDMIRKYNIKKENCFMIGDGVNDILSANEAGVNSVAVSWGFQSLNKLKECGANILVDDINKLVNLIG